MALWPSYASRCPKPQHESSFKPHLTPRKLRNKLGLDTPLCSAVNLDIQLQLDVRQGTTSISLKPKGPDGVSDPPRGACSRTDNPR